MELHETNGVTTLTYKLAFRDQAARDTVPQDVSTQMMGDGILRNVDNVAHLLSSRLHPPETALE